MDPWNDGPKKKFGRLAKVPEKPSNKSESCFNLIERKIELAGDLPNRSSTTGFLKSTMATAPVVAADSPKPAEHSFPAAVENATQIRIL
jgi:hypothetical protein